MFICNGFWLPSVFHLPRSLADSKSNQCCNYEFNRALFFSFEISNSISISSYSIDRAVATIRTLSEGLTPQHKVSTLPRPRSQAWSQVWSYLAQHMIATSANHSPWLFFSFSPSCPVVTLGPSYLYWSFFFCPVYTWSLKRRCGACEVPRIDRSSDTVLLISQSNSGSVRINGYDEQICTNDCNG